MIFDLRQIPLIPRRVARGDLIRHPLLPGGEAMVWKLEGDNAFVATANVFDVPNGVSNQMILEREPT